MRFFQRKSIIAILVIILKTIDDVRADCTSKLNEAGYLISATGLSNYFHFFKIFVKEHIDPSLFDHFIITALSICESEEAMDIIEPNLLPKVGEYPCYLLREVHKYIKLEGPHDWCRSHLSTANDNKENNDDMESKVKTCFASLAESGFILTNGVDNYAIYFTIKDDETRVSQFNALSKEYVKMLESKVLTNADNIDNTTDWCNDYTNCLSHLQKAEFVYRFNGIWNINVFLDKYARFGKSCDLLKDNEIAQAYCKYVYEKDEQIMDIFDGEMLKRKNEGWNSQQKSEFLAEIHTANNLMFLGSFYWCQLRRKDPDNDELKLGQVPVREENEETTK